jgi:hypothetical protein
MMPTKTPAGPNEVVRLEVLRLVPPLRLTGFARWIGPLGVGRAYIRDIVHSAYCSPPGPGRGQGSSR